MTPTSRSEIEFLVTPGYEIVVVGNKKMPACPRPRVSRGGGVFYPKNYTEFRKWFGLSWPTEATRSVILPTDFVDASLLVCHSSRGDLDNYFKTLSDCLEDVGVVENDRQIRKITVEYDFFKQLGDHKWAAILKPMTKPQQSIWHPFLSMI